LLVNNRADQGFELGFTKADLVFADALDNARQHRIGLGQVRDCRVHVKQ